MIRSSIMKRIISVIIFFLFLMPYVNAEDILLGNYKEVINTSNKYITMFSNYNKYIVIPIENGNIPYKYTSYGISIDTNFNKGGLLNYYEYEIVGKRNSYLSDAQEYYTMTNDGSMQYQITDINEKINPSTDISGARPTQYVAPKTKVTGDGTYEKPWVFSNLSYTVTVNVINGKTDENLFEV